MFQSVLRANLAELEKSQTRVKQKKFSIFASLKFDFISFFFFGHCCIRFRIHFRELSIFHVHGPKRLWRHYGPVAKLKLFPGSLLQHHRLSF